MARRPAAVVPAALGGCGDEPRAAGRAGARIVGNAGARTVRLYVNDSVK